MRLLIINFEMDDASGVLAWQASVARALAAKCDHVWVLTEKIGRFQSAPKLDVDRLEYRPFGIPYRLGGWLLAQARIARECRRRGIDRCFIHMNHPWAYRVQPSFRLAGIPVLLWYAHGTVTPSLRWALRGATRVITSTKEGFRIPSPKVRIVGQGVDSSLFRIPEAYAAREDIVYVGRVSARKRIDLLIRIMAEIARRDATGKIRLRIVGPTLTAEDNAYAEEMRRLAGSLGIEDRVILAGFIPQTEHPKLYPSAFLHLNVGRTGSMDKTVLEALACGCPVLTGNEAFRELLAGYPDFLLNTDDPGSIAERVLSLRDRLDAFPPSSMRSLVEGRHDQTSLVGKIMAQLEELG